jgi:hypothetical protein
MEHGELQVGCHCEWTRAAIRILATAYSGMTARLYRDGFDLCYRTNSSIALNPYYAQLFEETTLRLSTDISIDIDEAAH